MIEEFTGYYTGSVFHDGKLYRGGFLGEYEEYEDGRVIVTKAHTFRSERPLTDAIMLIRNPYDAFLSEFNRVNHGDGAIGNDHTGAFEIFVYFCYQGRVKIKPYQVKRP
jgi:hypothetical protein